MMNAVSFGLLLLLSFSACGQQKFTHDEFDTRDGKLKITFIGHGTLMLEIGKLVIHVDPWTKLADYSALPKADLILVTHEHQDHLDQKAIQAITKNETQLISNYAVHEKIKMGRVMNNGDKKTIDGIGIEAVPAYNTSEGRKDFHPEGRDNGYILSIGGKRIYIAGDTENTAEMEAMKDIDIAFLPMNKPYTMTPQQVARAAEIFKPGILYPYHMGESDAALLQKLMAGNKTTELRIRELK